MCPPTVCVRSSTERSRKDAGRVILVYYSGLLSLRWTASKSTWHDGISWFAYVDPPQQVASLLSHAGVSVCGVGDSWLVRRLMTAGVGDTGGGGRGTWLWDHAACRDAEFESCQEAKQLTNWSCILSGERLVETEPSGFLQHPRRGRTNTRDQVERVRELCVPM